VKKIFEKLPDRTLRKRITEKIKTAILTGTLHEGERLVERKLATQFGTSLTAVREALIQLEAEGFIKKRSNATTHVPTLSLEAAEQVFAVRRVLEAFAIEEAARLARPDQVGRLEAIYHELLGAAHSQNVQLYILKDMALHETTWKIAANEYLELALRRIVYPSFTFTAIRHLSSDRYDWMRDAQSHRQLIDAIKAKNPAAAREAFLMALDAWIVNTKNYLLGRSEKNATPKIGSAVVREQETWSQRESEG
jgi:DNA-binding GntR family transcriptional regulator